MLNTQHKKKKLGTDEYHKEKAEYTRQSEQNKKKLNRNVINTKATILQNAIRNKLSRNVLLQQKQNKANEVISKINQQRQADNKQPLINKLNAVVRSNDILKNLFDNFELQNQVNKKRILYYLNGDDTYEIKIKQTTIEKYNIQYVNGVWI